MDSLFTQFQQLASSADAETRIKLLNFAESIVQKLESPAEKLHRISMAVGFQLSSSRQLFAILMAPRQLRSTLLKLSLSWVSSR